MQVLFDSWYYLHKKLCSQRTEDLSFGLSIQPYCELLSLISSFGEICPLSFWVSLPIAMIWKLRSFQSIYLTAAHTVRKFSLIERKYSWNYLRILHYYASTFRLNEDVFPFISIQNHEFLLQLRTTNLNTVFTVGLSGKRLWEGLLLLNRVWSLE